MENSQCLPNATLAVSQKNTVTFNHPISVKLDEKNYLLWKQQVLAAINNHELQDFIECESTIPDRLSSDFQAWHKQDQLLLSWLLSSMTENMLTRVVGCAKSHGV